MPGNDRDWFTAQNAIVRNRQESPQAMRTLFKYFPFPQPLKRPSRKDNFDREWIRLTQPV